MNRATYSPGIARLDTVSRLDRFLRDRETPMGPSYVQSILFGRRWPRGTTQPQPVARIERQRNPGPTPPLAIPDFASLNPGYVLSDAAPAEPELEGPDPCAS